MNPLLDHLLVLLALLAAVGYLVGHGFRRKSGGGCGTGCSSCAGEKTPRPPH